MVKPLLSTFYRLRRLVSPNKASAQPTRSDPRPLTKWNFHRSARPFYAAFFSAPYRQIHWSLEALAVHPLYQGKGHGRQLVEDGLQRARSDPQEGDLPACVIAADGKEGFYQKCGFAELVGWISKATGEDGTDNPLRRNGVGGGAVLWTR